MVRIINGEIVSDNDPRVVGAQRRTASGGATGGGGRGGGGGGGGRQGRAGFGNVATLHDPPAAQGDGRNASRGGGGSDQAQQPGPLDKVADMIGVGGRFVTIPGALGVKEKQVPVIYLIIAALVVLWQGWKGAAVIVFAYIIFNQGRR